MHKNLKQLASAVAEFRIKNSVVADRFRNFRDAMKYYAAMLEANQLDLVISPPDQNGMTEILSVCEVWFISEKDMKTIENYNKIGLSITHHTVKDISFGDIMYVANVTLKKELSYKFNELLYYKRLLKIKFPKYEQCCWFKRKQNRMTKIFRIIRCK
jgi:hypothetical protein